MTKAKLFRLAVILIAAALLLVKIAAGFYVDWSWFKDLGYTQLFLEPIIARLQIGILAFLVYFSILSLAGLVGYRVFQKAEAQEHRLKIPELGGRLSVLLLLGISFAVSLFAALGATQTGWMKLLEYRFASPFGLRDLVFNQDISFYVFKMPLYSFILDALAFPLTMIFLVSVVVYFLARLVRLNPGGLWVRQGLYIPRGIRRFWAFLTAVLFIILALKQYLSMYAVMYSQSGYVYGAGYTDIHLTVPLAKVLAGVALLGALSSILFFFINDHRWVLRAAALYLAVAVIGGLGHGLVQYNVSNNEFTKENPYIQHEIKYTQFAYNLQNLQVRDYPGDAPLKLDNLQRNRDTIDNIRLNDPLPLKTVLSQNQGIRYYYRFNDIDIDRYTVDGKYREVLLAPREISGDALTDKAGTFVNLTMRYTHGYGAAATLANEIDSSGYARLIVKDIPPQSSVTGLKITEPRIYFGELTNDAQYGYVLGNTGMKEFDYPQGDSNVENSYQGSTGLAMTPLNKLFLSAYFNTFRYYLAGEVGPQSKLLFRRNIVERVQTLMPYLAYDQDPYLVAADNGKLYWIIDAYSTTDKFPYSAPMGEVNYIRNSVKVVVDAYNGTVNFYAFDPKDPILKTISSIFPGVFKDKKAMPSNLLDHIRYPEDLFNLQARVLLNFHVNNPSVFYNKEDTWDIAKRAEGGETVDTPPYYNIMRLPGEKASEFVLMLPFTPASRTGNPRNNMVAWLAARNDDGHYGELQLYRMPKNIEIQGPLMIDSLIDQDTNISGKMTLWGQGGSEVIRGNMLVVPIDNGFIYVEPIYIKAAKQGASIPQMQAIVFAIDKKIVMVETNSIDTAIQQFFSQSGLSQTGLNQPGQAGITQPGGQAQPGVPGAPASKDALLKRLETIRQELQQLEQQIRNM